MHAGRRIAGCVLVALATAGLAACGSPAPARNAPAPARLVRAGHSGQPSIVLSPLAARQIGIQTATSQPAGRHQRGAVVPYSALLYEPDGRTAVYLVTGRLRYARHYVTVRAISANQVLLSSGLQPGALVVTVGAEELLGVQNGVGAQT